MRERYQGNTFAGIVSADTLLRGGFKHSEVTAMLQKGEDFFNIYRGYIMFLSGDIKRGLYLVVGERVPFRKVPRKWFFGTFEDPFLRDIASEGRSEYVRRIENEVLQKKYRVSGKKLEQVIGGAVNNFFLPLRRLEKV